MSWMQSNQPHAGISLRREKTKLQSGTETVLISGGDRDGGKSEEAEQACTLSHTHTQSPLWGMSGSCSVEIPATGGKLGQNARSHAHAQAHEYAARSVFPRLVITALREHPAGCSYLVEEKERRRGGSEKGRTVKCERGGEGLPCTLLPRLPLESLKTATWRGRSTRMPRCFLEARDFLHSDNEEGSGRRLARLARLAWRARRLPSLT